MTPAVQSLSEIQRRLLRSIAWQILFVAACQLFLAALEDFSILQVSQALILALLAIPPLLSVGDVRKLSLGFILPLSLFSLVAPWELGGVRHPMALLPIVAIHAGAFLLGAPAAIWMSAASLANLLALFVCENRGLLTATPPSAAATLLFVAVFTLHALLFISAPLDAIRQFLSKANSDLDDRHVNESELQHITGSLESAVAQRREALVRQRARLQKSADEVSASMRISIAELIQASRELTESLPEELRESRWAAFRIAAGCERMETMQASLHRFCKLGEEAITRRPISPQTHTGLIHRIWEEVRLLHPDQPISFFLDTIPGCTCDAELLRQVWQNLLANAARSSVDSTSPGVRVYFRDGEFCVEDNGKDFDTKWAEHLFSAQPHDSVEDVEPTRWVGLSMARRIIEVHGGGIRAECASSGGGILRFHLPEDPAQV